MKDEGWMMKDERAIKGFWKKFIRKLNSEVVLTCEPWADFSEKLVMIMNDVVLFAGSGRQEDRPIICEQWSDTRILCSCDQDNH